jgi:lysophospholipase L1-like esterase
MTKVKICCIFILLTSIKLIEVNGQDWPNLSKYKNANTQLDSLETNDRIVFMGNSITELWTTISPSFFDNKNYVNRGISGQTTPQMLIRFRQDVINLNPFAVVILAGINDIAQNTGPSTIQMIKNNIISMIELANSNKIHVILCSVLPAEKFPWFPEILPAQKVVDLNKELIEYADKNNILYVDYFSLMVNETMGMKKELTNDGVHPNKKGYLIMEKTLLKAISIILE